MAEDNVEVMAHLSNGTNTLSPVVGNGQLEYSEAGDILDEGRSSSLSDLDDGAEEIDLVSANTALSRQIEADSEAETERLENSPNKNQNHTDIGTVTAMYTNSPSKLAQTTVPQAGEQETFSDSVISSPGPSDEDLESEMRSEHSAASDNEDNVDTHIQQSSPKKRKHLDLEGESGSEDAAEDSRRRRRRTQSVRSDAEEQSEMGLSREATIEPTNSMPNDQDVPGATANIIRNAPNTSASQHSKATKGKHGKAKGRETLKNILEEGEDPDKLAEPGADGARPETDEEERAEGEDEDVEAVARDEEECKIAGP